MPLDSYGDGPSTQILDTVAEAATVEKILKGLAEKRLRRANFDVQWREAALLGWPEYADNFTANGSRGQQGAKRGMQQVDSSVSIASHRFAAIINSLWTPSAAMWTRYKHPDDYAMKQRGVAEYYDAFSRIVWRERYKPAANFRSQNMINCQAEGMFGNMNLYTDENDPEEAGGERGLRYTALPVGNVWYELNHQGQVCGFYRAFYWTARQFMQKWPNTFPKALSAALEAQSDEKFEGIQYVCRRADWNKGSPRLDAKGQRYASYYVSVAGHSILEEKGYRSFPLATGRYMVAPDEDYGRGPMQMVLAAAKTKNMQKTVFLTQGHRAGTGIYLTTENASFDLELYPNAVNRGGLSDDGTPLARLLETGNIQITKEMMDEEGLIIDDAFLVTLFRLALRIEEAPNLSARQVIELIEQRAMFMAPIVDGPHDEYLGNLVPRELDVLAWAGLLPPRPPELQEAGDFEYEVEYENPVTRMMQAGENAAYMQLVETLAGIAQATGDSSAFDHLNNDEAIPGMARNRGVRPGWLSSPKMLEQKRKGRQQQAERDQRSKEMPGLAAIEKARAISAKAATGGNTGGTLSGTPEGGMPMMPGQQGPGGRAFGQPGRQ